MVLLLAVLSLAGLPEGPGLAARYPGDRGLARDPAVVFAEDFEAADLRQLGARWDDVSNKDGGALALTDDVPAASVGRQSLRVSALRGQNTGGHLYKVWPQGPDQVFLRFYVKFAPDYGLCHHFVSLGGKPGAPKWPEGAAGLRPASAFSTGLEPQRASYLTWPEKPYAPPGIWHFYTYWPEMHSYETPEGRGSRFYGNDFEPAEPAVVPRGQWLCCEMMVKLNSTPEASDGEQAFWIDGKLKAWFAPGSVVGYWMRDTYRLDPTRGKPFEGLRWRTDGRVTINRLWLSHYVSDEVFGATESWAKANPTVPVNTQKAVVWFDDLVLARQYIGPIASGEVKPAD